MEHKFSKHFCVWLKNRLAFLFCITFSLQCNAMCYNYGEVECKAGQYYDNGCKDCPKNDKDHYKCSNTTSWCAKSGYGTQGLTKCLDLKHDDGTDYARRKFVNGYCAIVSMYVRPNDVILWNNDGDYEEWETKHVDSPFDVPASTYGASNDSLASYGWVDITLLNKWKNFASSWFIKDGKKWYLPYDKIVNSNGQAPKECPGEFFAFGAQYCIKKGVTNVAAANQLNTITKDNMASTERLTYDQIEQYNNKKEEEDKLPDTVVSDTSSVSSVAPIANAGNLVSFSGSGFNKMSNLSNTRLVAIDVKCDPGNVLVNGECVPCTSNIAWVSYAKENRVYCPGGTFSTITPLKQQIDNCPRGTTPNQNLTGCDCIWGIKDVNRCNITTIPKEKCYLCKDVVLSFDDLKYGPLGKNAPLFKQCWTKVTEKAYKKCMGFDN